MSGDNGLSEDLCETARRMMNSAMIHQHISAYCIHQPSIKAWPFDTRPDVFLAISFELCLFSIEQSFRLLFLLHLSRLLKITNHRFHALFNAIREECGETLCRQIVSEANRITGNVHSISEKEIQNTLKRYNNAYSDLRYSRVDKKGKSQPVFCVKSRERFLIKYLSIALININIKKMDDHGLKYYPLNTQQLA